MVSKQKREIYLGPKRQVERGELRQLRATRKEKVTAFDDVATAKLVTHAPRDSLTTMSTTVWNPQA